MLVGSFICLYIGFLSFSLLRLFDLSSFGPVDIFRDMPLACVQFGDRCFYGVFNNEQKS